MTVRRLKSRAACPSRFLHPLAPADRLLFALWAAYNAPPGKLSAAEIKARCGAMLPPLRAPAVMSAGNRAFTTPICPRPLLRIVCGQYNSRVAPCCFNSLVRGILCAHAGARRCRCKILPLALSLFPKIDLLPRSALPRCGRFPAAPLNLSCSRLL